MNRDYSVKHAVTALLLVLVLVFSVPINIASPYAASIGSDSFAANANDTAIVPLNSQTKTDNTLPSPNVNTDSYKEEETMPGDNTILKPEEVLPDSDSGVTEIEPEPDNDALQDGTTIVPAKINNIMRDSLPSVISKKIYTFSTDKRGAVIYAFNHTKVTEQNCLWHITLYEEYSPDGTGETTDFRVLNRLSYTSIGVGEQSSTIGILPGDYRLEVECITGYTQEKYDILIGFSETDSYETEYNNSNSRYTPLPLDKTINGSASVFPEDTPDVDCYLFRITDIGYSVLYFDHEADVDGIKENVAWRISLTDVNGNEYYYTTSTMDKAMINSGVMGLPPGYYFVTVYSHVFSNMTYSLNVSFTKDEAIESELNDTPETADTIEINTEKIGSLTERNNISDRDYFTFTMENDGFVVIDFIHEALTDAHDGWNITVVSEDGNIAYSTVSDWNQAVMQSPNIGLTAGKYYIKVDSDNLYHNSIVYRLILLTVQSEVWETEPNNTPDSADSFTLGNSVNGTMIEMGVDFDKDYFALDVENAGTLNIIFNHIIVDEPDKEGWIISLVDADGNIIEKTSANWDESEISITADVQQGKYYLVVETGLYFNSSRYVLTATIQ